MASTRFVPLTHGQQDALRPVRRSAPRVNGRPDDGGLPINAPHQATTKKIPAFSKRILSPQKSLHAYSR